MKISATFTLTFILFMMYLYEYFIKGDTNTELLVYVCIFGVNWLVFKQLKIDDKLYEFKKKGIM